MHPCCSSTFVSSAKSPSADSSQVVSVPQQRTCLVAEAVDYLQSINCEPGVPIPASKEAPLQPLPGDRLLNVETNIHGVRSNHQTVYQSHVEMYRIKSNGARGDLIGASKFGNQDAISVDRRLYATSVMRYMVECNPDYFGKFDECVYDCQHLLISLQKPNTANCKLAIPAEQIHKLVGKKTEVHVEVSFAREIVIDPSEQQSTNIDMKNRCLLTALELITSKYAIDHPQHYAMFTNNTVYYIEPHEFGFKNPAAVENADGKYMALGGSKACRLLEGPKGRNGKSVGIVIDVRKALFYTPQPLRDVVLQRLNKCGRSSECDLLPSEVIRGLTSFLEGLAVTTNYGRCRERKMLVRRLGVSADKATFSMPDGKRPSVAEYFALHHGIHLDYPQWPVAVVKQSFGDKESYFPLECLVICDNQRVKGRDFSGEEMRATIRECAKPPSERISEIDHAAGAFGFNENPMLSGCGLKVFPSRLRVQGITLAPPVLKFGDSKKAIGGFRCNKFIKPAKVDRWAAVFIGCGAQRGDDEAFMSFVEIFQRECRNRGMEIPKPQLLETVYRDDELYAVFDKMKKNVIEFALFAEPDRIKSFHSVIKALEQKSEIITQSVNTKTVVRVVKSKSPQTLENVVNKTNIKLGGMNYSVVTQNCTVPSDMLFVGFGMGGAARLIGSSSQVSFLGYAANDLASPDEFAGNFAFQRSGRGENIDGVYDILVEVVTRFVRNRGVKPKSVVLYRNGTSEGDFGHVLKFEIPILKRAIFDVTNEEIPFTMVMLNRMHSVRFFQENVKLLESSRCEVQNTPPGFVVDTLAVHADYEEFYLSCHQGIHGTTKPTRCTVLYKDDAELTSETIKRITHALSSSFQIVTTPTSLPAPAYIANRYAERARALYNTGEFDVEPLTFDNGGPDASGISSAFGRSTAMNYTQSEVLRSRRINA